MTGATIEGGKTTKTSGETQKGEPETAFFTFLIVGAVKHCSKAAVFYLLLLEITFNIFKPIQLTFNYFFL